MNTAAMGSTTSQLQKTTATTQAEENHVLQHYWRLTQRDLAHLCSTEETCALLKTTPFTCGQKPIKYHLPVSKGRLTPALTQPAQALPRGQPGALQAEHLMCCGRTEGIKAEHGPTRTGPSRGGSAEPTGAERTPTPPHPP